MIGFGVSTTDEMKTKVMSWLTHMILKVFSEGAMEVEQEWMKLQRKY